MDPALVFLARVSNCPNSIHLGERTYSNTRHGLITKDLEAACDARTGVSLLGVQSGSVLAVDGRQQHRHLGHCETVR